MRFLAVLLLELPRLLRYETWDRFDGKFICIIYLMVCWLRRGDDDRNGGKFVRLNWIMLNEAWEDGLIVRESKARRGDFLLEIVSGYWEPKALI